MQVDEDDIELWCFVCCHHFLNGFEPVHGRLDFVYRLDLLQKLLKHKYVVGWIIQEKHFVANFLCL